MPTLSRPIPRLSSRKADHGVMLELALQGWRNSEIAKRCKVSEPTVKRALAKYNNLIDGLERGEIQAYRQHRSDLFTAVEREMMASLSDPDKIAKASLNNVAYAFQQIHTARRLEEEKSTANSSSVLHVLIEQQHSQLFSKAKHIPLPNVPAVAPTETDDSSSAPTPSQ